MLRYENPEMEILRFGVEDILNGSPNNPGGFVSGEDPEPQDPGDSTIGEPGDGWFTP